MSGRAGAALWPNWIRHRSTDPEIAGSSSARVDRWECPLQPPSVEDMSHANTSRDLSTGKHSTPARKFSSNILYDSSGFRILRMHSCTLFISNLVSSVFANLDRK